MEPFAKHSASAHTKCIKYWRQKPTVKDLTLQELRPQFYFLFFRLFIFQQKFTQHLIKSFNS